jgi:RNA polymerase sigma-70 factor (ECF subfamily)
MNDLHQLIVNEIPRLRRYARFLLRNPQAADDLVQDTLVRAVAAVDSWQPDSNMRAWLFTIMKNVMRNDFRRAKNADIHVGDEIDNHPATAVDGNQEARLALTDLQRALNELPSEFKQVVLLCAVEGFQYEEVASILNIPVGTVRSRLSRGRAALRTLLAGGRTNADVQQPVKPGNDK